MLSLPDRSLYVCIEELDTYTQVVNFSGTDHKVIGEVRLYGVPATHDVNAFTETSIPEIGVTISWQAGDDFALVIADPNLLQVQSQFVIKVSATITPKAGQSGFPDSRTAMVYVNVFSKLIDCNADDEKRPRNIWAIDLEFDCTKEVINEKAINQSILDILLTARTTPSHVGERPFREDYGSIIGSMLWGNIGGVTASSLREEITRVITQNESRIIVDRDMIGVNREPHALVVNIPWVSKANGRRYLFQEAFTA
jgi:phage baseplate assembly protein W